MSRMGITSEHEQMMCSRSWCLLATCSVLDNEIKPQHKAEPSLLLPETSHAERGPDRATPSRRIPPVGDLDLRVRGGRRGQRGRSGGRRGGRRSGGRRRAATSARKEKPGAGRGSRDPLLCNRCHIRMALFFVQTVFTSFNIVPV
jgi:hypothetical protein